MSWYVSFAERGGGFNERAQRVTKAFATEHEAKEFARAKSKAGEKSLMAGTINPATPKRVIPSASIPDWLDDTIK
jgi:hypothetical protein